MRRGQARHFWSMAPRGPLCLGSHSGFPESFSTSSHVAPAFFAFSPSCRGSPHLAGWRAPRQACGETLKRVLGGAACAAGAGHPLFTSWAAYQTRVTRRAGVVGKGTGKVLGWGGFGRERMAGCIRAADAGKVTVSRSAGEHAHAPLLGANASAVHVAANSARKRVGKTGAQPHYD